jgi:hypothetical protein
MKTEWLRTVLVLSILLLFANVHVSAQACEVKLADLSQPPEFMGFQLGMTRDQVKTLVPQVAFGPTDDFGVSKTTINPDFDPRINKAAFMGVRSISLDFLDGRLTSLWLGYDSTFKWKTIDAFVSGLSQSLKLPTEWQSWRNRGQQLRCSDFLMTVNIIAEGPSFRILDLSADDLIASRRAAKEEAAEASSADESEEANAVVADKRSQTYYLADCAPPKQIAESDRVSFKSVAEAERAGYKKANDCR